MDSLIETNQLYDFIDTLMNNHQEDLLFKVWLHKVYDKSFDEFKNESNISDTAQVEYMTEQEVKTTIIKSRNILSNFSPQ